MAILLHCYVHEAIRSLWKIEILKKLFRRGAFRLKLVLDFVPLFVNRGEKSVKTIMHRWFFFLSYLFRHFFLTFLRRDLLLIDRHLNIFSWYFHKKLLL